MWKNWQILANIFRTDKRATMADAEAEILTLEEVAAYLKAGKRTVYRLAPEGKLPAFKLDSTWRFRRSNLNAWIDTNLIDKDPGVGH